MARLRRAVLPGQLHLLVQRGASDQVVFVDDADRDAYLGALRAVVPDSGVSLHAFALLDREVRLLITPSDAAGPAALMQALGRRFVRSYNLAHGRSGTPWEGRFRSAIVDPEAWFLPCLRFVEATPADTGRWSSLRHHLGMHRDGLIVEHPAFWRCGNTPFEREAAYRLYLEQPAPIGEAVTIADAAHHGWALGDAGFAQVVSTATGRRAERLPRGRPRGQPRSDAKSTSVKSTPDLD